MPSFDATAAVARLVGEEPISAHRVEGGRNAEVTRIVTSKGAYALKQYTRSDGPLRLTTESAALAFLARHAVSGVPKIVRVCPDAKAILMTWIDGETISAPSVSDIRACSAFVTRLRDLALSADARALPDAKEACGSVAEILRQIDNRIERVSAFADQCDGLSDFLVSDIASRRKVLTALQRNFPENFPREHRTLSPSDFGFHNAVRQSDGSLAFLDFEYFGWDDPVKLVADFVLHPGMQLPEPLCTLFMAQMSNVFSDVPNYDERLADLLPAFRLRWALIMLNPILDCIACSSPGEGELHRIAKREANRARRFLEGERI